MAAISIKAGAAQGSFQMEMEMCGPTYILLTPQSHKNPTGIVFAASKGNLYVSMRRESPTRSLFIFTQPLPQCHSSHWRRLLPCQCNRKHQINKRNNYHIAEHTHVPRRPCYFSDNIFPVMKLVEGGATDPTNIPICHKLRLNHTVSQSYRIDTPSQNNSSFAGHCMQLV